MKRCPNCQRTYTDASLSYCLHDGTPLAATDVPPPPPYNPPAYNAGAYTAPPPVRPTPAARNQTPMVNQLRPSPAWSPMPALQPPRRSAWPWIIGVVAILGVMSLGVIILVLAIAARSTNADRTRRVVTPTNRNSNSSNANIRSGTASQFSDDFSVPSWSTGRSEYGDIRYRNGEYYMHANKGGYMVMLGPDSNYDSGTGIVRVTARSVDGVSPSAGYGLVVHAEKSKDTDEMLHYAFLIRTDEKPAYTVIQHRGDARKSLTGWTRSGAIRGGTNTNRLEVRTQNEWLLFYINGQYLARVVNTVGSLSGRVGLYTTGANEVAFDDLEITR